MNTVLICLLVVTLLPIMMHWVGASYRWKAEGGFDNKHPRLQAAKLEGPGHRAYAAQQNSWEALAMFSAALLALFIGGVDLATVATLSMAFVGLRVVFCVTYMMNIDAIRSMSFLGGFGICMYFFYLALTI